MTTIPTPSAPGPAPPITNVIESLKEYNQSQLEKVLCIENDTSTLDCDAVGRATTHENDMPELSESAAIAKTVVYFCFCCYVLTVVDIVIGHILSVLFSMPLLCHFEFTSTFLCPSLFLSFKFCKNEIVSCFVVEKIPNLPRLGGNANGLQ